MKLAFSTLPVLQYTSEELGELCQATGLTAEVRSNPDGTFLSGSFPISDIGSSICFQDYNEEKVAKAKELVLQMKQAGAPAVRVFLGNFAQKWDMPKAPLNEDGIAHALSELCDLGLPIWIETHNEYATGKALLPLLQKVNKPSLGIIWDILHPIEDGEDYQTTWALLKPYIRHLHIKDAKPNPDPAYHDWYYTKLGEGKMPLKELVTYILEDGYDGFFSLEWESAWRPELKGMYEDPKQLLLEYKTLMEGFVK